MTESYMDLAEEACQLATQVPFSVLETVASDLMSKGGSDKSALQDRIALSIPNPSHRGLVVQLLHNWATLPSDMSPEALGAMLLAAATSERARRDGENVELVWTGPTAGDPPLRQTEQAILQVIDSAQERLTVVSYAVYRIPRICDALLRAADRGVLIRIIVESPDRLEGKNAYDTLTALGSSIASRCEILIWPLEKRPADASGKTGSLHVKCVVADGRWLFLSSANLTEYAFTVNMELGVLVRGGDLPGQAEDHFDRMIQEGILGRP